MRTTHAVVFDVGNVLIRWDPHPAVAAAVGDDEAARFLAAADFDFRAWNHAQDAGRPWSEAETEATRSHPHWREHILAYRAHFARSLLGPVESSVAVLEELHEHGVPLFALTNWSAELFPLAREQYGFLSLFDDIVVSGAEAVAKPAPEIFEILARRIGHPLDRCVFIDDSPANVEAATRAGLDAILFTDTGHLRDDLRARGLPLRPA
jgi:2-haloacid dehalogenase